MLENIQNGKALAKFKELVQNQDGDISYIEDTNKFEKAQYILPVSLDKRMEETTKQEVTVKRLKAEEIGKLSVYLGGGRIQKEDKIDPTVGIVLNKKVGDKVKKGEIVAYIHANNKEKGEEAVRRLKEIYVVE